MKEPLDIHFAGGGTGGHLFPALALADEFRRRFPDCRITFWGTRRGLESRLGEKLGYPLRLLHIRGFRRSFALSNLWIPLELIGSVLRLLGTFLRHRPTLVIGTGGYVSGPVVLVATLLGIPTAIHEQNSYPGATTRFLARWVKKVYLTYESSRPYISPRAHVAVFGNPVRGTIGQVRRQEALSYFGLEEGKKTILVFGGSQGARGLNERMIGALHQLRRDDLQVLWATGPAWLEPIRKQVGEQQNVRLFPFIERMDFAYRAADLAVCRAGATTLAELAMAGLPAILIPFPYATANHQEMNARELERVGAAVCLVENQTTPEELARTVHALLDHPDRLSQMAERMKKQARPHAAADIVSDLLATVLAD